MALITLHRSLILILLLTIFVSVQSKSIESDVQQETEFKYPLRERRQVTTVPALLNALSVFVGQLLFFVANLLFVLGNSLPIILGALGLGGLGLSLDIIVAQLAVIVASLSGKKRRQITSLPFLAVVNNDVVAQVKNAKIAQINISNLATLAQQLDVTAALNTITSELNALLPLLSLASSTAILLQSKLNEILVNLKNVVNQIQSTINTLTGAIRSNIAVIFQGLGAPLSTVAQLGSGLIPIITKTGLSPVLLIFDNLAKAENATIVNLTILDNAFFSISNATVNLLLSTTNQLGNATAQALVSCLSLQG